LEVKTSGDLLEHYSSKTAFPLRYVRLTQKLHPSATLDRLEYARKSHSDYIGFTRGCLGRRAMRWRITEMAFPEVRRLGDKRGLLFPAAKRKTNLGARGESVQKKITAKSESGYAVGSALAFAFPSGNDKGDPRKWFRSAHKKQILSPGSTGTAGTPLLFRAVRTTFVSHRFLVVRCARCKLGFTPPDLQLALRCPFGTEISAMTRPSGRSGA